MKLTALFALLGSATATGTTYKKCTADIKEDKAFHHGSWAATGGKLWANLNNGCGVKGSCTQDQCATSCETLEACVAWTYGNGNRCYLLDKQHLPYVGQAPTNGAFNSAVCATYVKECDHIESRRQAYHHGSWTATGGKLWPHLNNGCGVKGSCTQNQCEASCETLGACVAWVYGNGNRCYLLDKQHLPYIGQAPTNGVFVSSKCSDTKYTPAPTHAPTAAPTPKPEEVKVELALNMDKAQFDATAQANLKAKIATQLGVLVGNVEIRILKDGGVAARRRLAAGSLRVEIIVKVQKEKVAAAIKAVEAPKFAASTGAKVTEITPSAGAGICASCTYDGQRIAVTHYRTATKLSHRCYHIDGDCSCDCL